MAHTVRDKTKLLRRVQRIIGQLEAVRRGLENEDDCSDIMHLISAPRGAPAIRRSWKHPANTDIF